MAYDFPASPTVGQVSNGFVWNGYAWAGNGNLAAVAPPGEVPPTTPVNGQLWWETDTGILFVWYNDGNTSQWVQISGPGMGDAPLDTNAYGRKNGMWVDVAEDAPNDGNQYVRKSGVWTSIGPGSVVVVTATAQQIAVAIPPGARRCRMSGYFKPGALNTNIGFRVSRDGGFTWLGGVTDYHNSNLSQLTTTVAGSAFNAAFAYIAVATTFASMATRPITVEVCIPEDLGEVITWTAPSMGYNGGVNNVVMSGYVNAGGPYTHFLLTGDATPYTLTGRVIAEFDA